MLLSWAYARKEWKALGILDHDQPGAHARQAVNENAKVKSTNQNSGGALISARQPKKPPIMVSIAKKGLQIDFGLEEFVAPAAWRHAESQGWLEPRIEAIKKNLHALPDMNTSFADLLAEKNLTEDEMRIVTQKVRVEHKECFAKYVCRLPAARQEEMLIHLKPVVEEILEFFGLKAR
jgi:hypothetical protein